jgi:hypothetical protein
MGVQLRSGSDCKMRGMGGSAEWLERFAGTRLLELLIGTLPVAWWRACEGRLWVASPDNRDSAWVGVPLVWACSQRASGSCRWRLIDAAPLELIGQARGDSAPRRTYSN